MNPETMKIFSTITLVEIEPDYDLIKAFHEHDGTVLKRMGHLTVEFSDGCETTGPVMSFSGEPDEAFYCRADLFREYIFSKHISKHQKEVTDVKS